MTKHKLSTSTARMQSELYKEINKIKNYLNQALRGIEKRKKQLRLDYKFKEILRNKYPKIYLEIVEELKNG